MHILHIITLTVVIKVVYCISHTLHTVFIIGSNYYDYLVAHNDNIKSHFYFLFVKFISTSNKQTNKAKESSFCHKLKFSNPYMFAP